MCISTSIRFSLFLFTTSTVFAQSSVANRYLDTAVVYQRAGSNYTKALKYFELAIDAGNQGNYTYYNAAQCACQCGQTIKAIAYYKKGFEKLIDFYNYEFFATDSLNQCFRDTPEWKQYLAYMKPKYDSVTTTRQNYLATIRDTHLRVNQSALSDSAKLAGQLNQKNLPELIGWIRNFDDYPKPPSKPQGTMYEIDVNDTLRVPFFVYIPEQYDATRPNPLYVFLHGGVSQRPQFFSTPLLYANDQKILRQAMQEGAVIIYPLAKKGFNWLLYQAAFETISNEIAFVKARYNIDDNRVYVAGHSDGGTGTFWLATHRPGDFAGLLGVNYNPMSAFNNTSLSNLTNPVHFYGVSGSEDNTFPIQRITAFRDYALLNGAQWSGFTVKAGHSLPYDQPDSVRFAFDSLFRQIRNPFPAKLQWETDDIKNGRYHWIAITELDTLQEKSSWHQVLNPPAVTINGKTTNDNLNKHKSGAVTATIHQNVVRIQQSRVKQLTLYVSPEMVDLTKPLSIYVNNRRVYRALLKPDKQVMIDEFIRTKDRKVIVLNKIVLGRIDNHAYKIKAEAR